MLKNKKPLPKFADGVLAVAKRKAKRTDFGARQNATHMDDLDMVCSLSYSEEYRRERDYEFADRNSFKLSMKVRTPKCSLVDSECVCVIAGTLYDISNVDRAGATNYLYLEEVGRIAS